MFNQVAGHIDERRGDEAAMDQVEDYQQQERLARGLALGGSDPGWAGDAGDGGDEFDAV